MTSPPDALSHVSRETQTRLEAIVGQVRRWQPRINLISPSTLATIWERHVADSLQLSDLAPQTECWVDLGSGGGFPGLVVAAARTADPRFRMHLIESSGKKCAFLRETARLAELPVAVHHMRIEEFDGTLASRCGVVSARALAPLVELLGLAEPFLQQGAIGLFPKGQDVDEEVRHASAAWHFDADLIQSRTDPKASILRLRSLSRRNED